MESDDESLTTAVSRGWDFLVPAIAALCAPSVISAHWPASRGVILGFVVPAIFWLSIAASAGYATKRRWNDALRFALTAVGALAAGIIIVLHPH